VLIPRQETEELVDWIRKDCDMAGPQIVDIGTGSGCIATSLSLDIADSTVYGIDVSPAALSLAKKNAKQLGATVHFRQLDILANDIPFSDLDIVVSNPPYVLREEMDKMADRVLNHEPHLALFVPDDAPLLFYRAIAEKAKSALKSGARLYVEINERFGLQTIQLLEHLGYEDVILKKDLNGKDRMIRATLNIPQYI
jgi:release factor glutamine methyltransferase